MNAIPQLRLSNQCIARTGHRKPADLVSWLGAVQAQEFGPAKWGLGLRLPAATTDAAIDRDFDAGLILRTHVLRPTWHFVARPDIRWMLELTAPRVHRVISHYCRKLGLDAALCRRAAAVFERALDAPLTRTELSVHLQRAGIAAKGVPLAMLSIYAELEAVICSGPRRGKNMTYARLADRARGAQRLKRDEARRELTARYFHSHGPATVRDFVWWSGLTSSDARRGLEINRATQDDVDGRTYWRLGKVQRRRTNTPADTVHLLPIYDEYLVSYRDRATVPDGPTVVESRTQGAVRFQHTLVIGGQVAGTWRASRDAERVALDVVPLRRLTRTERAALEEVAKRYGRFTGLPVSLAVV